MTEKDFDSFLSVTKTFLSTLPPTEQSLDEALVRMHPAFPSLSDDDVERAKRQIMELIGIDMDLGTVISDRRHEPWLDSQHGNYEWIHWRAFKELQTRDGWSPKVLDATDQITNKLLDLAGDPQRPGEWKRRGLAIGDVQSGKTATYLALFNKAVDVGYRLIVVLAGGTEILRQQTQKRIDEGLIGRDSKSMYTKQGAAPTRTNYVGVGTIDRRAANAHGMTTVAQDFKTGSLAASNIILSADASSPFVFVLKKNKTVLDTLHRWLQSQPKVNDKIPLPILLLDDESDYASVNTRKEEEDPTAINQKIKDILGEFSRSSYLAFTATPFANIFIDVDQEEDLFPRDYVYSLRPPSNYVGVSRVFESEERANDGSSGSNAEPHPRTVVRLQDAQQWLPTNHRSHVDVDDLPLSLTQAIETFFVANAIRDLRGDERGRSMLVNVSRFRAVQRQVFEEVEEVARELRNAVDLHMTRYLQGTPNAAIDRLKRAYARHYSASGHTWSEVANALPNASTRVVVQLINSDRDKKLAEDEHIWETPPRVIAVGGDVLSRGLTLEGLTVSYFHRNVGAYDTLMQMGRWFGYRDGFEDLCRVWIDADIAAQYVFIQNAVDELRDDLELMNQRALTPEDFGLVVRKHPGTLLVTARNKMRAAEAAPKTISMAGRIIESVRLSSSTETIDANLDAVRSLILAMGSPEAGERPTWRSIDKNRVAHFLDEFRASSKEALFLPGQIAKFVRERTSPHLAYWDVVLMMGRSNHPSKLLEGTSVRYIPPVRLIEQASDTGTLQVSGRRMRLAGPTDVSSLLPKDHPARQADQRRNERDYYQHLPRPTLFLYLLEANDNTPEPVMDLIANRPLVAVKVAIPGTGDPKDTSADASYMLNKVAQRNLMPELIEEDLDDADA